MTSAPTETQHQQANGDDHGGGGPVQEGAVFVFEVEGTTYEHNKPKITGGEIMDIAGVPRSQGLIQLNSDGTTTSIAADEEIRLVPGARFKRRPRFKRG